MASSSTSSLPKRFKYDVFLSFRGEDVRKTFIDHLYASLDRQGILTFRDDKRLEKGERIDNELIRSIQDSKIFIIVFSQNYASSSWCLNELVEIMECQKNNDQIAYPVFYNGDPSEVRKQRELYGEALAKYNKNDADKWREALREAGSLSGYDVKNIADGHEAEVIKKIVAEISNRLRSTYYVSNDEKLVGMETRIPHLLSCIDINSNDVRMIGIKGMGGAGKTTMARAIFERICFKFDGVSFVDNVRENSKASPSGLQSLQGKVLSDVLKEQGINISSSVDGKRMMENRLRGIKTLLVLDDVDDLSQLEALAGAPDWFKPGSRIIITTRDDKVLLSHRVEMKLDLNLLSDEEAICLFNMYACKGDIPIERYEQLSLEVVRYAAGLPLTIKVMGSLLHGEDESVWIDVLKRLKTIPLKQTLDTLELSYKSLEDEHKEIFLHVACLLKGSHVKLATKRLESRGFRAHYGLTVLKQKSLITFFKRTRPYEFFYDGDDDAMILDMHDRIQEMGQNIVRRKHPEDPSKHSRLWIEREIKDVLVNELGTEATRCIYLAFTNLSYESIMKGLRRMKNLKFLFVIGASNPKCDEESQYHPNALQCLCLDDYPFCSLPKRFRADNLVTLEMTDSNIRQLWEGGERKVLHSLAFLKFCNSKLTKLDFGLTPNLETLFLSDCSDLVELDITVECPKLRFIHLLGLKLTKVDLRLAPNLKTLHIFCCHDLVELNMPVECLKLRSLKSTCVQLMQRDLSPTPNLEMFILSNCKHVVELGMHALCIYKAENQLSPNMFVGET